MGSACIKSDPWLLGAGGAVSCAPKGEAPCAQRARTSILGKYALAKPFFSKSALLRLCVYSPWALGAKPQEVCRFVQHGILRAARAQKGKEELHPWTRTAVGTSSLDADGADGGRNFIPGRGRRWQIFSVQVRKDKTNLGPGKSMLPWDQHVSSRTLGCLAQGVQ